MVRQTGVRRGEKAGRRLRWGALLLGVAALTGCAGARTFQAADQAERLKARAVRYWDARLRGDLLETYTLHPPAFRKDVTFAAFAQGRGAVPVLEYEIKDVRVNGPEGIVAVRANYTVVHPQMAKPIAPIWGEFEEQWILVGGEWYQKFRAPTGEPYPDIPWNRPDLPAGVAPPPSAIEAPVAPID